MEMKPIKKGVDFNSSREKRGGAKRLDLLTLRIRFEIVYRFQLPGSFILTWLRADPHFREVSGMVLITLISY